MGRSAQEIDHDRGWFDCHVPVYVRIKVGDDGQVLKVGEVMIAEEHHAAGAVRAGADLVASVPPGCRPDPGEGA